jgi:hypothetical protein
MKSGSISRRRFMTDAPRLALAGALAAATGVLVARPSNPVGEQPCVGGGVCRGCGALARCGLPRALSARAAGVRA